VDLRLPDGSGGALVQSLRALSPFTEVILITGDATLETAAAAVIDGAFAYLLKPFASDMLLETVRRALAHVAVVRERQQLSDELQKSERRHREVVEAVPAFVVALDAQGRIALWNRRLEEATGFSRDEGTRRRAG
jgi:DNA-binding NtrC family response regulator